MADESPDGPIVLFDGVCNLCNWAVQFIMDRDREGAFKFASLQSRTAQRLLSDARELEGIDSVVLVEGGRCYVESSAALRIARRLWGPWKVLYVFIVLPRFLRDAGYRFIAKRRYQWFGKRDQCRVPTPEERGRLLE